MEKYYIIGGILILITVLIMILFTLLPDLYLLIPFKLRPKTFRNFCIRKYKKGNQTTYVLGTLHGWHLSSAYYTLNHIKAVIENLKPDLLLLESRQSEFDRDNLADGPPEMLYSHLYAKEMNIPVKGIDWWSKDENTPGTTNNKRDNIMVDNIMRESNGSSKILVIEGASHMIIGGKKLKKLGYKRKILTRKEKNRLFSHEESQIVHPKGTKAYVSKRIELEKLTLTDESMDEKWKEAANNLIQQLERYKDFIVEAS